MRCYFIDAASFAAAPRFRLIFTVMRFLHIYAILLLHIMLLFICCYFHYAYYYAAMLYAIDTLPFASPRARADEAAAADMMFFADFHEIHFLFCALWRYARAEARCVFFSRLMYAA